MTFEKIFEKFYEENKNSGFLMSKGISLQKTEKFNASILYTKKDLISSLIDLNDILLTIHDAASGIVFTHEKFLIVSGGFKKICNCYSVKEFIKVGGFPKTLSKKGYITFDGQNITAVSNSNGKLFDVIKNLQKTLSEIENFDDIVHNSVQEKNTIKKEKEELVEKLSESNNNIISPNKKSSSKRKSPNKKSSSKRKSPNKKSKNKIWTYIVLICIGYFFWPSGCEDTRDLVNNRTEKFSASELDGTWKGRDALSMHTQTRVVLELNSDGTWSSESFDKDDNPRNTFPKQSGTFYTGVENFGSFNEHYVYLDWKSPYGLRTSKYKLSFAVDPFGEESEWSATDLTEEGFYLTPLSSFIATDVTLRGDIW